MKKLKLIDITYQLKNRLYERRWMILLNDLGSKLYNNVDYKIYVVHRKIKNLIL